MANTQQKQATEPAKKDERTVPAGGEGRIDEVGKSGVYPVSEMDRASPDAIIHGQTSLGQGEQGAQGYADAGTSEIFYIDAELRKPDENAALSKTEETNGDEGNGA